MKTFPYRCTYRPALITVFQGVARFYISTIPGDITFFECCGVPAPKIPGIQSVPQTGGRGGIVISFPVRLGIAASQFVFDGTI